MLRWEAAGLPDAHARGRREEEGAQIDTSGAALNAGAGAGLEGFPISMPTVAVRRNANPARGNAGEYAVTSVGDVDTDWNSDYAAKGYEYFDVWAPEIATRYGEVFWTDQGKTPLPPDIVERFDGKVIAIQGYEQVRPAASLPPSFPLVSPPLPSSPSGSPRLR